MSTQRILNINRQVVYHEKRFDGKGTRETFPLVSRPSCLAYWESFSTNRFCFFQVLWNSWSSMRCFLQHDKEMVLQWAREYIRKVNQKNDVKQFVFSYKHILPLTFFDLLCDQFMIKLMVSFVLLSLGSTRTKIYQNMSYMLVMIRER